ncbi:hypothetical protein [Paenibacillus cineris]|uniref:hypothetical protein n=1 Tax=Paenibacillus cineris TaxID=237530 RepID=UPI001B23D6D5|nr:hypothetical protein [Paenibacillus cineris]GIO63550.1 hypothetical protein J43TS9_51240 [Paenibacillus cineris]
MAINREPVLDVPGAKKRQNIYLACEEMNFIWSEKEVGDFLKLWKEGRGIPQIAAYFDRDPDEVGLLVIDQARKGNIKTRNEPAGKGQSHKVIATVEKVKKETPTVISIHGMRYVLEHPDQGRSKSGKVNPSRQSTKRKPHVPKRENRTAAN